MKIALWTTMVAFGLTLAACGHGDNNTASTPTGNMPPGNSGSTGSAPSSSVPTDFAAFVNQQVGSQPAFGSAPAATTSLTMDTALGTASTFSATAFGAGDALPAGTNQAAVACTQAGPTVCNPAVSADLNSTLN